MKMLLLALLAAPAVHAQVTECPKFYPWEDTLLTEVPYQHTGKGLVAKSKLSGASVYAGEWNCKAELIGDSAKVAGGTDIRFGFQPGDEKWLVCTYGSAGEIQWWERLDRGATRCTLQIRGRGPVTARLLCASPNPALTSPAAR